MPKQVKTGPPAKILSEVVKRMAVSAIKQMQETGDIDSVILDKAIDSAFPKIPRATGVCFVPEENALAFKVDEKYVIVEVGGNREWFLCHVFFNTEIYQDMLPDGPYQSLDWDELYAAWDREKINNKIDAFKRSMRSAANRINKRCINELKYEFSLFSYGKDGVRLHMTRPQ